MMQDWIYIGVVLVILAAIAWPLGQYMARVFNGERTLLSLIISPLERGVYKITGVDFQRDMRWTT